MTTYCPEPDYCDDWLFDSGDPSTGVTAAWVCQKCGAVDVDRDPLTFDDDMLAEREKGAK